MTGLKTAAVEGAGALDAGKTSADKSLIVLKFGSSVLRAREDLFDAVSEIYRHARRGVGVVAVVSAFDGETDRLLAEAETFGAGAHSAHGARFAGLGEERAAALLALACNQTGLDASVLSPAELGLRAAGDALDAEPTGVDAQAVRDAALRHDVVIAPGFVATDADGAPVLLGRGGTDLTAVALAEALGLGEATLLKDVPGLFDRDPAVAAEQGETPLFFDRAAWSEAARASAGLLQPKALDYAERRAVTLQVAAVGAGAGTAIGPEGVAPRALSDHRPLRVAVAGLGVVGEGAVNRLLRAPQRFEIVSILISNPDKPRGRQINPALLTTSQETFLASAPDVVLDALSSGAAGREVIEAALARGIGVATANKQAIAGGMAALTALAEKNGADFAFSPSVGGGAPMVETMIRAEALAEPTGFDAVLNGTVNFILSHMGGGASFDEAVKEAQEAGFAEADPSADLSGDDAVAKAKILSFIGFGAEPDDAHVSVSALTAEKAGELARAGGKWRQMTRVDRREDGPITVNVDYVRVDDDPFFAGLEGEGNALRVETREGGVFACRGRGAGRAPTVESLLSDLFDIERRLISLRNDR